MALVNISLKVKICIYCMQTTCQNIMNKCSAEQMTGAYSSGPKNPAAVFSVAFFCKAQPIKGIKNIWAKNCRVKAKVDLNKDWNTILLLYK